MISKPSDTQAIGLHLDGSLLKLAEVEAARGKVKVKRLEGFSLSEGFSLNEAGEKPHFGTEGEDRICRDLCSKKLTVASLDGKETLVRKMKMKLLSEKDVEEAFKFEAEGNLPYPLEEGLVDKIFVGKDEDHTYLTLLSCKKSALSECLGKYHALKLDPEVVSCTPAALASFAARYTHVEGDLMVLYIGENSSLSTIVRSGKLIASHSLPIGISLLRKAYKEDTERDPEILSAPFDDFDFGSDDVKVAVRLKAALEKMKHDVSWMVLSEIKNLRPAGEIPLITLGEGANLKGLDTYLLNEVPCQRAELITHDGIELNQSLLRKFAIAIGSALSVLPKHPDPINFRQEELAFAEPWKRFKASLIVFAGASLLLAFLILLTGFAYLGFEEDILRQKYSTTLAQMGKSYQSYEKEFLAKGSKKGEVPPEITPIKDISVEAIKTRLNTLEKEIASQPDLFPLLPAVPLVSDTLAWLSNHPQMRGEEGVIKIENFNYQMVKRPEMAKKGEKYQVKVDLEISAPTPKMAREFHTALITPNDFVDPKAEVKWGSSRGKYQTSFYLKDKTVYLPVSK